MTPSSDSRVLIVLAVIAGTGCLNPHNSAWAVLIVNPPRSITHRLEVQIIQTSLTSGSQSATVFGNSTQRADIEAGIDQIWAQAGIDISFLPTITTYSNSFAFQGTASPRPTSDLSTILANAAAAGKLHPNPQVLNMFFVKVLPGRSLLDSLISAGYASINGNGSTIFVGSSLLGSAANRDIVAGVVAHEIGHNLGLSHTAPLIANLMSQNGTSDQLTPQQIAIALQSDFLQQPPLGSDFSGDGIVNGADLTIWQNFYGVNANGDADGDNDTDGRDFLQWQREAGSGTLIASHATPEPGLGGYFLATTICLVASSRGRWGNLKRPSTMA